MRGMKLLKPLAVIALLGVVALLAYAAAYGPEDSDDAILGPARQERHLVIYGVMHADAAVNDLLVH
ncbi:MAG TPA: hypothetical protein VHY57_01825, partial [Rhizomicrobium sp.]|nr:hypothetical protein [Rhizomicrobium sp.]